MISGENRSELFFPVLRNPLLPFATFAMNVAAHGRMPTLVINRARAGVFNNIILLARFVMLTNIDEISRQNDLTPLKLISLRATDFCCCNL